MELFTVILRARGEIRSAFEFKSFAEKSWPRNCCDGTLTGELSDAQLDLGTDLEHTRLASLSTNWTEC